MRKYGERCGKVCGGGEERCRGKVRGCGEMWGEVGWGVVGYEERCGERCREKYGSVGKCIGVWGIKVKEMWGEVWETWKCGERWRKVCWGVRGGEKKCGERHGGVRGGVGKCVRVWGRRGEMWRFEEVRGRCVGVWGDVRKNMGRGLGGIIRV